MQTLHSYRSINILLQSQLDKSFKKRNYEGCDKSCNFIAFHVNFSIKYENNLAIRAKWCSFSDVSTKQYFD